MTIIQTMSLLGLLGLAMHLELYWMAGIVAFIFVLGVWYGRRAARRRAAIDTTARPPVDNS